MFVQRLHWFMETMGHLTEAYVTTIPSKNMATALVEYTLDGPVELAEPLHYNRRFDESVMRRLVKSLPADMFSDERFDPIGLDVLSEVSRWSSAYARCVVSSRSRIITKTIKPVEER